MQNKKNYLKTYEFNVEIHQLFIDFKQVHYTINRQEVYTIMIEFFIPTKIFNLVKVTVGKL
jgi:hypothetical protein